MSAAGDEAIATLSGASAVLILAAAQYILARSSQARRDRERDDDDDDKDREGHR